MVTTTESCARMVAVLRARAARDGDEQLLAAADMLVELGAEREARLARRPLPAKARAELVERLLKVGSPGRRVADAAYAMGVACGQGSQADAATALNELAFAKAELEKALGDPQGFPLTIEDLRSALDPVGLVVLPASKARHLKRDHVYDVLGTGQVQADVPLNDYDLVRIYVAGDGTFWVRRSEEFDDGRFEIMERAS